MAGFVLKNTATLQFNQNTITSNETSCNITKSPTIVKSVDKTSASSGDVVTYTFTITNPNATALTAIPFSDAIDTTLSTYLAGSFKVNSTTTVPTTTTPAITYTFASLAPGTTTVSFQATIN